MVDYDTADTIVFVHGQYLTARSWELWEKRNTDRGYKVINKSWPGIEGEVEALRKDPSPIAKLNVADIIDHYDRIMRELPRPPIMIGHSFGGAFTQVLVSRELGAAAVGVAAGTVRGVFDIPLITVRSNWKVLRNPIVRHRAIMPWAKEFQFAFTNTFTERTRRRRTNDMRLPRRETYCSPESTPTSTPPRP